MSAGLRLKIDLDRLAGNWRRLAALSGPAECAAAVKADAYGIGLQQAVPALSAAGCKTYFVALPDEGVAVREAAPGADIYVLNGFFADCATLYRQYQLRPVLGNPHEVKRWTAWRTAEPAALHVDTGMNRLGLSSSEMAEFDASNLKAAGVVHLMSHLACADMPDHSLNREQSDRFQAHRARFSAIQASLANSAGIHAGSTYHHDMVRPGIALYGGASHPDATSDPVVTAHSRILQIRHAAKGESVGYGAAETLKKDSRIAILSAGYADGYLRAAATSAGTAGAAVAIGDYRAPLVGRISMDLIAVDVTDIPEPAIEQADWAELFGDQVDINHVAAHAGTIAYELLTGLSHRAERIYTGKALDG
jgi:alanine racemase